jgi:hypothetical protein
MTTMRIDDGGGSAEPPAQSIMDSMNAFAQTAASGGFAVTDKGGKDLIQVIDDFQHWIDNQANLLTMLAQQRKLGTSNGAKVMAPYTLQVATDGQGFVTQLGALRDSLDKARQGIEKAMENYRKSDEGIKSAFKGIAT